MFKKKYFQLPKNLHPPSAQSFYSLLNLFAAQLVFEKEMSGNFLYVRITYTTGNSLSSNELASISRVGEKPQLI